MESTIENVNPIEESTPKRPMFLTVICMLSFIWEGLMILCFIIALLCSSLIFEKIEEMVAGDESSISTNNMQIQGIDQLLEMGVGKFCAMLGVVILLFVGMLLGVIKMWKLQKTGFFIYAAINGLFLVYNVYNGSYVGVTIDAVFISLYAMNLKHMTPSTSSGAI